MEKVLDGDDRDGLNYEKLYHSSDRPLSSKMRIESCFVVGLHGVSIEELLMPTLSDSRRLRVKAKQRKARNALKRTAKAAKRERKEAK